MYVYLQPQAGFNDILTTINLAKEYCIKYNRILLIDGTNSAYNVNFSDYFNFKDNNIICDINKIIEICSNNNTIYPECLNNKMLDIINKKIKFRWNKNSTYYYNDILLNLPTIKRNETIIVCAKCGGLDGYILFKELFFCENVKEECKRRYNLLEKPYLCIQIRNTDRISDYTLLYDENEKQIKSFNTIYIATDDKNVVNWYKEKGLPIKNFTTFPEINYKNLHRSNIDHHIKIIDTFCDIYICAMSDKLLSNSPGGFIRLIRSCNNNKTDLFKQFQ